MIRLRIRRVGNSLGVTLPKAAAARLRVRAGDTLVLTESPEDGWRLTPYDPDFTSTMDAGEDVLRRYRNALRALRRSVQP